MAMAQMDKPTLGKAVVTSDGFTIIEALSPAHPVAGMVFKALKSCHKSTGDGSKTFLLYLSFLIKEINFEISQGKFCHNGANKHGSSGKDLAKNGAVCVRHALREIVGNVLPEIEKNVYQESLKLRERLAKIRNRGEIHISVCQTMFMPHFNPKVSKFLAEFVMKSLSGIQDDQELFKDSLTFVVKNFFAISIKVPNRAFSECSVFEPLLIKNRIKGTAEMMTQTSAKAVILKCGIDDLRSGEIAHETVHVRPGQITALLLQRRKVVTKFAEKCEDNGVTLLVCTENIPDYAVEILQRHNISVITYVTEESVELLENLTSKISLATASEKIDGTNVIALKSVKEIIIGGQIYTHLEVSKLQSWKHLIICGPAVGLCDQVAITCQKALICLKKCYIFEDNLADELGVGHEHLIMSKGRFTSHADSHEDSSDGKESTSMQQRYNSEARSEMISEMGCTSGKNNVKTNTNSSTMFFILPGGGSFEVLMSNLFSEQKLCSGEANVSTLCRVIERVFKDFVHSLYENMNITRADNRGFLGAWTMLTEKLKEGELYGFDRRANLADLLEKGIYEPTQTKLHIFRCVLSLVEQLIGVDRIVNVKSLPADESDSD
ncbi:THS-like protein [Mya arenaria]|uniref:THS-like protein n=1 Tax=Mya arenaria TaxID=6604 RepID=A0ABY7EZ58_MYAAR|nr:THS-like protein [Mya arenaria]